MSKKSSRRGSRRGATRTIKGHPGVMGRTFGSPVDPDSVMGRAGDDIDGAMRKYETFHAKKPIEVVKLDHDPPKKVVPVGDALSVMYRTDKWYEDGKDVDYKHLHDPDEGKQYQPMKGVRLYESAHLASSELKRNAGTQDPPRPYPEAWARLGYCLGLFVRRDDDGEIYEVNPRGCWLMSTPDGHMLAVYSPKPQSDGSSGFLCVMAGGKLRVLKDGIDG